MKILLLAIVAVFFVGCSTKEITPEQARQTIDIEQPENWTAVKDNGKVDTNWIKSFNDETLEKLVKEALENNKQIASLQAKVEQSNASVKQVAASLKPSVNLAGGYSSRNDTGFDELYGGGVQVSWELDVWGRLDARSQAAEQANLATQSDYKFARNSLVGTTAKSWFMTTGSKIQLNYTQSIIKLYEKELKIMKAKHEVGQVDLRSVHLVQSNLASSKNAYSKAKVAYEDAQRNLEVLLGRYPSALIEGKDTMLAIPEAIPAAGIPSGLLERRPDLVAAQQRVAAAFYKQREAELLKLPSFTFSIGAAINNLTDAIGNLAAGVVAPLYDGGAIEAEVENATAVQKQTINDYAQVSLEAFKEVERTLSLEEKLLEQEGFLKDIVLNNKKNLKLTKLAYDVGQVEYLEVSQAQNKLIASEISLLDISSKRLINRVNLHLALGGEF